ncbi:MAG: hypothetical protein PHN54_00060 [Bacilli bacterium]|nr:hypothetical protein [Bacilli bacterium]
MNNKKSFGFLIWVALILIVVVAVFLGLKFLKYDGEIDTEDGYHVIELDNKKVLVIVKDKKYKGIHTFSSNNLMFLGEYDDGYYYVTSNDIIYYSFKDKKEHLWLEVDKGVCTEESPCGDAYSITQGLIIGDTLYYHIRSASVGDDSNNILSIKLNAKSIDEREVVVPYVVMAWQVNDDNTKFYCQGYKIVNGTFDSDKIINVEYDVINNTVTEY